MEQLLQIKMPANKKGKSVIPQTNHVHHTTLKNSRNHKASKKDLITVTDHAPDVICRFDKSFRLVYVNPAIEKATGVPAHIFMNKTTRELGLPEDHSRDWESGVTYVFRYAKQTTIEFPFLTPKGPRHFQSLLVPEFNTIGEVETVLSISRDITDIREVDKRKDEVVGFVSHELKTPLTSLKIFAQMLQQKFTNAGDTTTASHLAKMNIQINKLTNIIGDLTEATRIENKTLKIQLKPFDFYQLVTEIVEEVQKTTNLHTIVINGEKHIKVVGDRFRIGQVLTNLLTNAIKYSPKESEITLAFSQTHNRLTCSVEDHGVGIPPLKQKKIFERFYRIHDSQQKANLGLGLGLYISAEIIKKHHGKIWVESKKRKGSRFCFTLPIK